MATEKTTCFQVYDRTRFKYYTYSVKDSVFWSSRKPEAKVFDTREEAEKIIAFLKVFQDHNFVVLPVQRVRPVRQNIEAAS